MGIWGKIIQFINDWSGKLYTGLVGLTAKQKQQLILLCTGVFSLVLTLAVILSITSKESGPTPEMERRIINSPIPAGELFLPDEPDFVLGILLERDRRTSWTEEDAAEYWQDPLRFGEEQWREKIETAIDEFMERIP